MAVFDAVSSGDRRIALEAVRDHLAERLQGAPDNVAAPIAGQLVKVMQELEALPKPEEGTALDELTKRRARRSSAS
jgi:hypothetical protein